MKKGLIGLVLALLLTGTMAAHVDAATIDLYFNGVQDATTVARTLDGVTTSQTIGLFHFTRTGGDFAYLTDIYTFCIEPQQTITQGVTYHYDVVALQNAPTNVPGGMGTTKADQLRALYAQYYPVSGSGIAALTAQALQIATWEIVRETSTSYYDVSDGNIYFGTGNATTLAQTMLNYINVMDNTYPLRDDIMAAVSTTAQDPWIAIPNQVAEPATLLLMGLGLIGLAGLRRKE